ncbi:4'-phosphopantetheinyl transferase superfamily protein [Paraburkholderia sp. CNPSo 3157]|uniref:4'-phosphopantetheinyl transferase superfamily protein n=1 Tax=Paraburkholderia franconis TaxID=2654983 RepID=A0A7X1NAW7_9BURK|nr:4'-phosphopantetheinyl transferase superfamily protein [Paraburkholderia franconis]MPW18216.1 4'-phosphopantetheinyl transferase superfamily protein [Paraburkholderia franconis]
MQHDVVTARIARNAGCLSLSDPSQLFLPDKAVHVWILDEHVIGQACSSLGYTLSLDERQHARAYRHESDRNNFIARRSMLRWLIGVYLRSKPESLRFNVSRLGKPALQRPRGTRLAFNVSHTDGIALLAFALNCRVGIDVERRIDCIDFVNVGRGVFSPVEEGVLAAARIDSAAAFLSIWTRKEALLKALGSGLLVEPTSYTTEDALALGEGHWHASNKGTLLSGWTCLDLSLGREVQGALAVSLDDARVMLYRCSPSIWASRYSFAAMPP